MNSTDPRDDGMWLQYPKMIALSQSGGYKWFPIWAFRDHGSSSNPYDVYAREFSYGFTPYGYDFVSHYYVSGHQFWPSGESFPGSDRFVVVFQGDDIGSDPGVYARLLDSNGDPVNPPFVEFSLPEDAASQDSHPWGATYWYNGDRFVAVWQRFGGFGLHLIYMRIFDDDGYPITDEIQVSQYFAENIEPVVAAQSSGIVVTWESTPPGGSSKIVARTFDKNGIPYGNQFDVSSASEMDGIRPSVAADSWSPGGTRPAPYFVVTWLREESIGANTYYTPMARLFKNLANPSPQTDDIVLTFAPRFAYGSAKVVADLFVDCSDALAAGFVWSQWWFVGGETRYGVRKRFIHFTDSQQFVSDMAPAIESIGEDSFSTYTTSVVGDSVMYVDGMTKDDPREPDVIPVSFFDLGELEPTCEYE